MSNKENKEISVSEMRDKQTVLFKDKIRDYFARPRLYDLGVQISSHYISGIQVLPKEGKTRRHFVLPLEGGTINPSFNKKNITNSELLENKIKEGLKKIHISAHNIVFLLPELSQKAFIFNFDSFPSSQQEREHLIRFRANKQMPLLPDDIRLSFDIRKSNRSKKILTTIVRSSVIKEYENLFGKLHLKVRVVGIPSLSVSNLLNKESEKDIMFINVEEDSFSLVVNIDSEIALYRQKPFGANHNNHNSEAQKIRHIVQEVKNTINFIEDRDKRRISCIIIRLGLLDREEEIFVGLKEKLHYPLKKIESYLDFNIPLKEKEILSPLIGQLL